MTSPCSTALPGSPQTRSRQAGARDYAKCRILIGAQSDRTARSGKCRAWADQQDDWFLDASEGGNFTLHARRRRLPSGAREVVLCFVLSVCSGRDVRQRRNGKGGEGGNALSQQKMEERIALVPFARFNLRAVVARMETEGRIVARVWEWVQYGTVCIEWNGRQGQPRPWMQVESVPAAHWPAPSSRIAPEGCSTAVASDKLPELPGNHLIKRVHQPGKEFKFLPPLVLALAREPRHSLSLSTVISP
jgi:hypothetical protein